jgi:glycosyltransferase involved in cell wall biosynthesis
MTDTKTVQEDLPELAPQNLEIISEFRREDLPALLADCTVGAFPSYVEGFGLAVLEQLAAGLPTVAYDIPGPRDILNDTLPELLIPCGETERFAATLCRVLTLSLPVYTALSKKSIKATSLFSWEKIASDTISEYQALLDFGAARRKNGTGDDFF